MGQIQLTDEDKKVLRYIQEGHDVMSELFDMTGWPGEKLGKVVEKLDESRYIERLALQGLGFWSFRMTDKGNAALPPLSPEDEALREFGLCKRDIDMLKVVKQKGKSRATQLIVDTIQNKADQVDFAGSVVKLLRRGYLSESGFLKRIIEMNPKGEDMLSKV
ncbi:hypothetical protein [Papillibacter cinnamivorans]|uniref:Uncharacterized protein n=1 Tax=Papillibacter cinnamivorans DSM 12816 TaxID=1122930 RepID=A0A1W2AI86_9FIRM|nr:hypothetical protein [Papillibacter cinnamivorans]SMC60415.1 hypothetical protein SAMN02745168_1747 [Papillibacter cinnamivorans DSM 12816]